LLSRQQKRDIADHPPRLVLTTDVNGTISPDNTFAELVRPDNRHQQMAKLMKGYTTGAASFSEVLPLMVSLADRIDRQRLDSYTREISLFSGVKRCLNSLAISEIINSCLAFSTTGFAGLMALLNSYHHKSMLKVAASMVLVNFLTSKERKCLIRPITEENDKVLVLRDLIESHRPHPGLIFHVGDTLGDFPGLVFAAECNGIGIAFCPNEPLVKRIQDLQADVRKKFVIIRPSMASNPDYLKVFEVIQERLWVKYRTEIQLSRG
jgi:phosphoserine phosphatase